MQSRRGEEGINLLSAVSNFSGLCPGKLRLRHSARTEGAPSSREQLQMSLLQSSQAVQMLLKHDRNTVSSLNLLSYLGASLYSTEITRRATPLSSKNYGWRRTCVPQQVLQGRWLRRMNGAAHALCILYHSSGILVSAKS